MIKYNDMITNLIREKRKTLSIIITKSGEIQIKAPKNLPLDEVLKFVKQKESWIVSKQNNVKEILSANKDVIEYDKILFLGNEMECMYCNNIDEISYNDKKILIPEKFKARKHVYLMRWLKNRASEIVENRVLYFSANYNLCFKSTSLMNARTRWGTCSSSKELEFNWRLIMLSPKLIDYLIVHELMHLIEMNHSSSFWKLVEVVIPEYKNRRQELKKCDFILSLFR